MKPADARAWLEARGHGPVGTIQPLTGGLLNHVFRVELGGRSAVLKHAPPHLASQPEISLDPSRAAFEAAALRWLESRSDTRVRTPHLLDADGPTLLMEDLGARVDLRIWLQLARDPDPVEVLARWLRALHEDSSAPTLHNLPVQQTRLTVQYAAIGPLLQAAGVDDAGLLGEGALALGRRLLQPGPVFVMGDLWPASVLLDPTLPDGDLALIDWELATTGHRAQDLGHLLAHLWLGAVRGNHPAGVEGAFLAAYGEVSPEDLRDSATHFACELLVRTHGPFLPEAPDSEAVKAASLAGALAALRTGWLPGTRP